MDQLKDFLRQCVKYRFWIAIGVAMLLPMIGYFVGVGGIIQAKDTSEAAIKKAKTDITKYKIPGIPNNQWQPLAAKKGEVLSQDVDESWRKLRALQEPLLRWPPEVEAKFLAWGRKFPQDVDKGEVTRTLVDYTFVYPAFVNNIYKIFKPFNYEDGTGIVVAPDEKTLLRTPTYSSDNPPDLSKVWAEQERLWVVTALLDAIAKINDSVKAKDWDGAIVKQINLLEVGGPGDLDQKTTAEGLLTLVGADVLAPDGTTQPPAAPTTASPMGPGPGGMPLAGPSNAAAGDEVYYLKNDAKQFKTLPIKLTVLVDQNKLPDFLVGLENSPITIQVLEAEVSRPPGTISRPVAGERSPSFGSSMSGPGGMGGGDSVMGGFGRGGRPGGKAGEGGPSAGMMRGGPAGGMGGGGVNKSQQRKDDIKADKAKKADVKPKAEQFFNIVEVTVYGQARFYLAPPPAPVLPPSTSAAPAAPTPPPATTPAPKAEEPKVEAPKTDAPKEETPKADVPKAEAPAEPKVEAPKPETPKTETPAPKS